jgi:hypothetical protein
VPRLDGLVCDVGHNTIGFGKRLTDEALSRHVANEDRLLLSLTEAEQQTLDALPKKLIAGL